MDHFDKQAGKSQDSPGKWRGEFYRGYELGITDIGPVMGVSDPFFI